MSFLCNRVIEHDVENYDKLERAMKYIHGTIGMPLILPIENYGNMKWYVYEDLVLHSYIRSHTGGFMDI